MQCGRLKSQHVFMYRVMACSSGTSGGKQKIFPSTAEELDRKLFFYGVQALVRNMYV